jgi:hypothetical protein
MPACRDRSAVPVSRPSHRIDQGRRRLQGVAFEIRHARHRLVVEIERTRVDQVEQNPRRQPVAHRHVAERRRDRIGIDVTPAGAAQRVTPPLQPDLARHRFAGELPCARHLEIEGIDRVERAAIFLRREQRGEEAILVARAHEFLAMVEGVRHVEA